ncbi:MAG TPA: hypothetical protein ENG70_05360 [Candidatus Cloacimonetes bacterium]|nr:hypothetical protein [Candidatus Cloacimonadota bacterium]HEX38265.1 hypothetical protein [Candidatus Cloacimonadota bacterium]
MFGDSDLNIGEQGEWHVTVKNTGLNTENNYSVSLMRAPGIVLQTENITDPLAPDATTNFTFNWTPDIDEVVQVYGYVDLPGDEFEYNNYTGFFQVNVYPPDPIEVLIWDNDNNSDIDNIGTEIFLENALSANNILYDTYTYLPADLSAYDAVLVALGIYCLG